MTYQPTTSQQDFLTLIRLGLNLQAHWTPTHQINWATVFNIAKQQSMLGITFDGVTKLPQAQRPPFYIQWAAHVLQIEKANKHLNTTIHQLHKLYQAHNVPCVIMKGQAIARHYPHPLHRQCGDIDVFVGKKHATRSRQLLEQHGGIQSQEAGLMHAAYKWQDTTVEIHRLMTLFASPLRAYRFNKMLNQWFPASPLEIALAGENIHTSPALFDALFVLKHCEEHIFESGIGLRQPIDWLLHIAAYRDTFHDTLEESLKKLDLYSLAQTVAYIGVHYLGFAADVLPMTIPDSCPQAEMLLQDILAGGNFGYYNQSQKTDTKPNKWHNKWQSFQLAMQRKKRLRNLSPAEARWLPFMKIQNRIYAILNK